MSKPTAGNQNEIPQLSIVQLGGVFYCCKNTGNMSPMADLFCNPKLVTDIKKEYEK